MDLESFGNYYYLPFFFPEDTKEEKLSERHLKSLKRILIQLQIPSEVKQIANKCS